MGEDKRKRRRHPLDIDAVKATSTQILFYLTADIAERAWREVLRDHVFRLSVASSKTLLPLACIARTLPPSSRVHRAQRQRLQLCAG